MSCNKSISRSGLLYVVITTSILLLTARYSREVRVGRGSGGPTRFFLEKRVGAGVPLDALLRATTPPSSPRVSCTSSYRTVHNFRDLSLSEAVWVYRCYPILVVSFPATQVRRYLLWIFLYRCVGLV